jgi:hypothetical protein
MRKIADTGQLQTELQRVLDYARGPSPSRVRIARDLSLLSARVAPKHAAAKAPKDVLKQVESKLKAKFPDFEYEIEEDKELESTALSIEPKHREPGQSICIVSVNADLEASVSIHSRGSGSSSIKSVDFGDANVSKLVAEAEKRLKSL